ncbi:iron-containing alcohol dehydrogenase [Phaeovulum sp.]|uniref:iron-containing alcohol dehydrogenase n=1 Tax=Phaeovulum sp. TaxID=2934796 RepID=UPI0027316347|nr:iron-containing alcohol dehydrogenase [Phaeovulum sp.]MDP1667415.1 iron-containing alcohol dehydrogenase [Phaeovulum sp.]MDZ4119932.1 iron-containing alcohol dehydrogenase [Phaeovulum sp.]
MTAFAFHTARSVLFRPGGAADLGPLAGALLGPRVLFVTDPGIRRLGLAEAALASLGPGVTIFAEVEADPSRETLLAAVAAGQGATGVVGFGGGSAMDVAKLAALLLGSGEPLDAAWGVGNAKGPRLPLVLVPTTAGTGSEVTPVAIITVGAEEKRGVSAPVLLPDLALLDPELTLGLPPAITAATGIDAMVHAIEAYATVNPNANPISKLLAREALRLLGANIETAVRRGGDRDARGAMLMGAMLAGQAFANAPVAAVHALAYPLGGIFHIPHGLSNALVLPQVLAFNASVAGGVYAEIAADAFPDLAAIEGGQARCAAFIEALAGLRARLGLPSRLSEAGVPAGALPRLAAEAMKQTRLLVNNPRPVTEADALAIYREAW